MSCVRVNEIKMIDPSPTVTLILLTNGRLVGYLCKSLGGAMSFQYAQEWLDASDAQPISLSLPLRTKIYEGDRVYNFFDNLLPDSAGIRTRIQTRFKISTSQPFDLLRAIGADCVGAIQLCVNQTIPHIEVVNAHPLSTAEIAQILRGYQDTPLGMITEVDDFRISIAGAQEKTALLWYQNQWCRPTGTTPTSHIFKLPIGNHSNLDLRESCENEWLCLEIAKAFGLPAAKAQLASFDGVKVLVVERFDRRWSQDGKWLMRLPQEDFCQILGVSPNLKYQNDSGPGITEIMQVLQGSRDAERDRELFFRSQILFWLLGAIDGHAKNFSVYLEPGGSYCLTPLYDIISAYPLISKNSLPSQKIKMAMALKGTSGNHYLWSKIQPRHFLATAKLVDFSVTKAEQILQEMLSSVEDVASQVSQKLPADFPEHISSAILEGMITLASRHRSIYIGENGDPLI
jgi:serine/threonine-protein kinase HipA